MLNSSEAATLPQYSAVYMDLRMLYYNFKL